MAKRILANFQQMRAEKSVDAPTVIDPDGNEHAVGVFPLDFFLEILELQNAFGTTSDSTELVRLLERIKGMIQQVIPTFPVGKLDFSEAQLLVGALVSSVQPDGADAEPPKDEKSGE